MSDTTTRRAPMAAIIDVTVRGESVMEGVGAGAPAMAMIDCALEYAPRTKSARVAAASPGMRRFLNAGVRSKKGVSSLLIRDSRGNDVVDVTAVREDDAEVSR